MTAHDILTFVRRDSYEPLKLKALARKLGVPSPDYAEFRDTVKDLIKHGRLELAKNRTIRGRVRSGGTSRERATLALE